MPAGFQSSNVQLRSEKIKGYDSVFSPIGKTLDRMIEVDNRRKDVEDARNFQIQREDVATENRRQDATVAFGRQNEIVDKQQDFQVENINLQNLNRRAGRSQQFGFDVERDKTNHGFKLEEQTQNNGFRLGQIEATNSGNLAVVKQRGSDSLALQRLKNKGIKIKAGKSGASATYNLKSVDYSILSNKEVDDTSSTITKKLGLDTILRLPENKKLKDSVDNSFKNVAAKFNALPKDIRDIMANQTKVDRLGNPVFDIDSFKSDVSDKTKELDRTLQTSFGLRFNTEGSKIAKDIDRDKAISTYQQALKEQLEIQKTVNIAVDTAPLVQTGKFNKREQVDVGATKLRIDSLITDANKSTDKTTKAKALKDAADIKQALSKFLQRQQTNRKPVQDATAKVLVTKGTEKAKTESATLADAQQELNSLLVSKDWSQEAQDRIEAKIVKLGGEV